VLQLPHLVPDHFAAVGSKYEIPSISQKVADMKTSIWKAFAVDI